MPEVLNTGSAGGLAAGGFRRTRPRPVRRARHQPRIHRISFDIPDDRSELFAGSNPPVEILPLPKGFPRSSCQVVGANGGGSFQPAHNLTEILMRLHHHVDMVGHDNPGNKIVATLGIFTIEQGLHKGCCDIGVLQPLRSFAHSVQLSIMCQESPSRITILNEKCGLGLWKRACQAPSDEDDRVVRDPMRKFSLPEHVSPRNRRQDRRCYRDCVGARCSFSVKLTW
jgi:hypothetical protein